MKRIAIFFGTRPEAIKMAPVVAAFRACGRYRTLAISTGQHHEMLRQVVDIFALQVDHEMGVMTPGQTLAGLSARLLERTEALLEKERPDLVLVQGDTTTVLMVALACFYRNIPVGHVEAGLRTGNLRSPFPEEANRRLAGTLATLHFAPTELSRRNLLAEGIAEHSVVVTGNTVIDALEMEVARQEEAGIRAGIQQDLSDLLGIDWHGRRLVLITGHRRENFGGGMEAICRAVRRLSVQFADVLFVYPVHLNPNVCGPVQELLSGHENIRLIEPQAYRTFVALMRAATLVLTDSGGVQEEAPGLGKPVLVMRDTTERPEGVEAGTVRLVGADEENIVAGVRSLLEDSAVYRVMAEATNPYGDGRASVRIVEAVDEYFKSR